MKERGKVYGKSGIELIELPRSAESKWVETAGKVRLCSKILAMDYG